MQKSATNTNVIRKLESVLEPKSFMEWSISHPMHNIT